MTRIDPYDLAARVIGGILDPLHAGDIATVTAKLNGLEAPRTAGAQLLMTYLLLAELRGHRDQLRHQNGLLTEIRDLMVSGLQAVDASEEASPPSSAEPSPAAGGDPSVSAATTEPAAGHPLDEFLTVEST